MSLSKRTRFEVFKRDGFKCCYCGRTPPTVILEADHINPKSMGGSDTIDNLITACFDCNRGKSDIPLSSIPETLTDKLKVMQDREKQIALYNRFVKKEQRRMEESLEEISGIYSKQYAGWTLSESFRMGSVRGFIDKLSKGEVINCMYMAIGKIPNDHDAVIPYFCGICWNKIRDITRPFD